MIRSIKVRAWDYVWEKMFTSEQITSIDFENNCIEYKDWFKYDDEEDYVYDQKSLDELWLMQSTGLQDKNGVEIFEGDIVKRFDKLIEVVEWNDKKGWWCLNDGSIGLTTLGQWHQAIEIIGNIYENKELLQ